MEVQLSARVAACALAGMFYNADTFDQSLDAWNVQAVTDMRGAPRPAVCAARVSGAITPPSSRNLIRIAPESLSKVAVITP